MQRIHDGFSKFNDKAAIASSPDVLFVVERKSITPRLLTVVLQLRVITEHDAIADATERAKARVQYFKSLRTRSENGQLTNCVKALVGFMKAYLDTSLSYFEKGKPHPAVMIAKTLATNFVESVYCKESYLTGEEEIQLSKSLVAISRAYLASEELATLRYENSL